MPTSEGRLLDSLGYDANTGAFVWIKPPKRGIPSGSAAGSEHSQGYVSIGFGGRQYFAHRVAWRIVHGAWPDKNIDHINGDKKDNRISNLRNVQHRTNLENLKAAKRNNKCGVLGVTETKSAFVAHIGVNRKNIYLGSFRTSAEAHAAYLAKKRELHEGCTI